MLAPVADLVSVLNDVTLRYRGDVTPVDDVPTLVRESLVIIYRVVVCVSSARATFFSFRHDDAQKANSLSSICLI